MWKAVSWAALSCAAILAVARPAGAQATPALDDSYWSLGLSLGLGGQVDFHLEDFEALGVGVGGNASLAGDEDAKASVGGFVSYVAGLHRYFGLGGRFGLLSWRSAADTDAKRNLAFDLSLMPQARAPVGRRFELYVGVPVGFSLNLLHEVERSGSTLGFAGSLDADVGTGLNLSVLAGFRAQLTASIGLFAELGYALHKLWHRVEARGSALGVSAELGASDVEVRLDQLGLNLGLYF